MVCRGETLRGAVHLHHTYVMSVLGIHQAYFLPEKYNCRQTRDIDAEYFYYEGDILHGKIECAVLSLPSSSYISPLPARVMRADMNDCDGMNEAGRFYWC